MSRDYHDDYDPETGELLAREALGADSQGPRFTTLDPHLIQDAYIALSETHADAYAAYNLLELTLKPLRAKLYLGYRAAGRTVSDSSEMAECHASYKAHIEAMVEARRVADRARGRMLAFDAARDAARAVIYAEGKAMRM